MKIRYRLILAIFALVGVAAFGVYRVSSPPIVDSFRKLENEKARDDVLRIHRTLMQEVGQLHSKSVDWSNWEDSYDFMLDRDSQFIKSNLAPSSLTDLNVSAILFLDKKGNLFYGARAGDSKLGKIDPSKLRKYLIQQGGSALSSPGENGTSGMIQIDGDPVEVSIRPILHSDGTGPARGTLVFARLVDLGTLSSVREVTRNLVTFVDVGDRTAKPILPHLRKQNTYLEAADDLHLIGYSVVRDLKGEPALLLQTTFSRQITQLGEATLSAVNFQLLLVQIVVGLFLVLAVEKLAISRLVALSRQVESVEDVTEGARVSVRGTDELGVLAARINEMLAKLQNGAKALILRDQQLQKYNESLEQTVLERTQQIEHQAFHDKLTNLPNRALFRDRLNLALTKVSRSGRGVAVLFVDLDNFKLVNDSLGHGMGDQLLIQVAEDLTASTRAGDTVARLGGDEFTLLLEDLESQDQAVAVAMAILGRLRKPKRLDGRDTFACASIGVAFTDDPEVSAESLLKRADTAMYRAKADGKSTSVVYEPSMEDHAAERLELETGLRTALENGDIYVRYQPLIDLETNALMGAEALARWRHPTRGNIPPSEFIPLAEANGMIIPIGYWILGEACRQAAEWVEKFDAPHFVMSVNLSGKQLQRDDVVDRVQAALKEANLPPSQLKLEITESVLMADREAVIDKMTRLKALGVQLALDDFGTGYSSLSTLQSFPIDTLKIDRSFISRLGEEEGAHAIVEAILALAKTMRMNVTGEGVETDSQREIIRGLGCNTGQGYLYDRPLSIGEFEERLTSQGAAERSAA